MNFHLVNCRELHPDPEHSWLIVGEDSSFTAAVRALDYFWPKWTVAHVTVRNGEETAFEFKCTKDGSSEDVVFEIPTGDDHA